MSNIKTIQRQCGIGLLELMLSLIIISTLLVMATRYYNMARQAERVNEAISLIEGVIAASANWVVGQDSYAGVSISKLVEAGYLPKEISNGVHANPWSGPITVMANKANLNQIHLEMSKIPKSACINIANKLYKQTMNYANNSQMKPSLLCVVSNHRVNFEADF